MDFFPILIVLLIFAFAYGISFLETSDESFTKFLSTKDSYIEPKNLPKQTQKKLIEEYYYWLINSEYINFNDYNKFFPYIKENFNPQTEKQWISILHLIKKELT